MALPAVSQAASSTGDDLAAERVALKKQIEKLKKQEQLLYQESLRLDQQAQLLDRQMGQLRGTGTGPGSNANATTVTPATTAVAQATTPAGTDVAQATTPVESAPITGPSPKQEEARRTLEAAPSLSSTGGVLTPKNNLVIDPSLEYDYYSQNQLGINGFSILPGITFGNIFVSRVEENVLTAAVTGRYGITNRLEVNVKIPYVYEYGTTTSTIPVTPNAVILSPGAHGSNIGDIQFGASYQINAGEDSWPIFVGNLLVKSATGTSPFDVPIYTVLDQPNGQYLQGIQKELPTGTGFWAIEPSLTILYPTAPGVLFANVLYQANIGRTVGVTVPGTGAVIDESVHPGNALAVTFGIGFALNDRASMTFSYQQEHVFTASEGGNSIAGSSYDYGTFNFGMGYELTRQTRINIGVGIGAGQYAPVAKVLVEMPFRFAL